MYDNYNYPMGTDTEDAPWNQPEPKPIDMEVDVLIGLRHETTVRTINCDTYTGKDHQEEIKMLYMEQHKQIPELLEELANYIKGELADVGISFQRRHELEQMLDDCYEWQVGDIDINDWRSKQ